MNDLQKLEFIHSTLQEFLESDFSDMVEQSIEFLEEIREREFKT